VDDGMPGMVVIGHAYGPMEAGMAASLLAADGVPHHLHTRHTALMAPHYMTAFGGIAVLVPRVHAVEAARALEGYRPGGMRFRRRWLPLVIGLCLLGATPIPASGYFGRPAASLRSADRDEGR